MLSTERVPLFPLKTSANAQCAPKAMRGVFDRASSAEPLGEAAV